MTKEVRNIVVTDNYPDNIVWGSIDPISGDIVLYPPDISLIIENGNKEKKTRIKINDFFGITINYDSMIQTTKTGLRSIFREDLSNDDSFVLVDNHTITKKICYNNNNKAWYLDREITHLGFVVDTSGSMSSIYHNLIEMGIENFIEEQKTISNKVLFYGSTFSTTIQTLYNQVPLKEITDLRDGFYSITPSGCTACYDAVISMLDNINTQYSIGEEVVVCIITDGADNSSHYSKKQMIDKITKYKKRGWNIVIMGANNFDVETVGEDYSIGRDCSLNVGLTREETCQAFRSVSNSISRVRQGVNQNITFTDVERTSSNTR